MSTFVMFFVFIVSLCIHTNALNLTDEIQEMLQFLSFDEQCTVRCLNRKYNSAFDQDTNRCQVLALMKHFQQIARNETALDDAAIKIIYNNTRMSQPFLKMFPRLLYNSNYNPLISNRNRLTNALNAMTGWSDTNSDLAVSEASLPNCAESSRNMIQPILKRLLIVSRQIPRFASPTNTPNEMLKFSYRFCYEQLVKFNLFPPFEDIYDHSSKESSNKSRYLMHLVDNHRFVLVHDSWLQMDYNKSFEYFVAGWDSIWIGRHLEINYDLTMQFMMHLLDINRWSLYEMSMNTTARHIDMAHDILFDMIQDIIEQRILRLLDCIEDGADYMELYLFLLKLQRNRSLGFLNNEDLFVFVLHEYNAYACRKFIEVLVRVENKFGLNEQQIYLIVDVLYGLVHTKSSMRRKHNVPSNTLHLARLRSAWNNIVTSYKWSLTELEGNYTSIDLFLCQK